MFSPIDFRCSFCGAGKSSERKLIAGPRVFICNGCVSIASLQLLGSTDSTDSAADESKMATDLRCSFCWKSPQADSSLSLVLGIEKSICSKCLNLCDDILVESTVGKWSGLTVVLRPGLPTQSFESKQQVVHAELVKNGRCRVVVLFKEPSDAQAARDILSMLAKSIPPDSVVSDIPMPVESDNIAVAEMIEIPR